jgi:hypothetical protein
VTTTPPPVEQIPPAELDQARRTSLAVGLLLTGAQRQRELERALSSGEHRPLQFRTVGVFTVGGVALAVMTVVLVIAQT